MLLLILSIAVCLFGVGCSEPAPSALEPEAGNEANPQKPYEIQIVSLPMGYEIYNAGIGLAEIINKNSTWLKAVGVEGKNPTVSTKTLIAEPNKKKNTIFFMDAYTPWAGQNKIGGYADVNYDFSKFRGLYTLTCGPNALIVVDPNIKTLQDLKGKTFVPASTPNSEIDVIYQGIFEEAGILDDVNIEYMNPPSAAEALRDGKVDAIMVSLSLSDLEKNEWLPSPSLVELVAMADVYPLSIPAEHINAFAQKSGCPAIPLDLPPGTISPLQTEPLGALNKHLMWGVHVDMPDNVVNEILSIVYENMEELKKCTTNVPTQETMATMGFPEELVHPAAVQFYKKHNIPITSY